MMADATLYFASRLEALKETEECKADK